MSNMQFITFDADGNCVGSNYMDYLIPTAWETPGFELHGEVVTPSPLLGTAEQFGGPLPEGMNFVPISCQSEGSLEVYIEPVQPAPHLVVVGHSPRSSPSWSSCGRRGSSWPARASRPASAARLRRSPWRRPLPPGPGTPSTRCAG